MEMVYSSPDYISKSKVKKATVFKEQAKDQIVETNIKGRINTIIQSSFLLLLALIFRAF
jgi:hypothetical protein